MKLRIPIFVLSLLLFVSSVTPAYAQEFRSRFKNVAAAFDFYVMLVESGLAPKMHHVPNTFPYGYSAGKWVVDWSE